jgi:hypothetical protein
MDRSSVISREGNILCFLESFRVGLLCSLPGDMLADPVHRQPVGDPVKPRAQRSGVLEPSNSAKHLHPHVLQDVVRRLRIPGQLGGVLTRPGPRSRCYRQPGSGVRSTRPAFGSAYPARSSHLLCRRRTVKGSNRAYSGQEQNQRQVSEQITGKREVIQR